MVWVARAIHELSARSERDWVAVNMAVMPEAIAAATLFGHSKGAFTGAQQRHRGVFERAAGGTLFLDEIGETPPAVQPMLLRALETGKILSVGDEAERDVDVRIVAATDAHLEQDVAQGSFRAALLHRLAGYELRVPPLRERRDDAARLLAHFLDAELRQLGEEQGLFGEEQPEDPRLSVELVTRVLLHPLPGNVRQLRNFARHLAIAGRGKDSLVFDDALDRLLPSDPPRPAGDSVPPGGRRPGDLTDEEVLAALEAHGWAPGRAAQSLDVPTSTLHDLMRRMGIRRATDLSEEEVAEAEERCAGDVKAMARLLRVSERALRLAVRQHKPRA
jgi:two-component system nitrogen regulation response regulator GlnG